MWHSWVWVVRQLIPFEMFLVIYMFSAKPQKPDVPLHLWFCQSLHFEFCCPLPTFYQLLDKICELPTGRLTIGPDTLKWMWTTVAEGWNGTNAKAAGRDLMIFCRGRSKEWFNRQQTVTITDCFNCYLENDHYVPFPPCKALWWGLYTYDPIYINVDLTGPTTQQSGNRNFGQLRLSLPVPGIKARLTATHPGTSHPTLSQGMRKQLA